MNEEIYVKLLGEEVDVWRPVKAERLNLDMYRIANQDVPDGEAWEFQSGSIVRTTGKEFQGKLVQVVVSEI